MEADCWPPPAISTERREPFQSIFLCCFSSSSSSPLLRLAAMAPIRQFSAEEKGKAPREGPDPLSPKKRPAPGCCYAIAWQETSGPWYERPPPGFPLPLYARTEGPGEEDAERHHRHRRRRRRVTAVRVVTPGVHAEGSSRELVLHAAMPPRSWILLPPSFAFEIPPRGPFRL